MIESVTRDNLTQAASVHALSWRESHSDICTAEFIALHTTERQTRYLQGLMDRGASVYMLSDGEEPVGIVSVEGGVIGNLYVLPEEHGKGYGTQLLRFAMGKCAGTPTLWVLDTNRRAIAIYERNGFRATGQRHVLSDTLSEVEMRYEG